MGGGGSSGRGRRGTQGRGTGGFFFFFPPRNRFCSSRAEPAARRVCRSRAAATPSFVCFGSGILCTLPPPAALRPRQLPQGFAPLPSPPREVPRSLLLTPKFGLSSALFEEKWWKGETRGQQGGCTASLGESTPRCSNKSLPGQPEAALEQALKQSDQEQLGGAERGLLISHCHNHCCVVAEFSKRGAEIAGVMSIDTWD